MKKYARKERRGRKGVHEKMKKSRNKENPPYESDQMHIEVMGRSSCNKIDRHSFTQWRRNMWRKEFWRKEGRDVSERDKRHIWLVKVSTCSPSGPLPLCLTFFERIKTKDRYWQWK